MAAFGAMTRELYLCVDVEPDGHVPGLSSIVALGACAAALRDDAGAVHALDPDAEQHAFYAVLSAGGGTARVRGVDRRPGRRA
jgi:hypothetical protein